ncbi:SLAM family member 5-like [Eublepharis macularius]|uniref:SLAM family member 5-like n=1 Tax=Eublepharis macularius TaxID=481883 RepID=A0AA97KBK3_EUBMA|nr:SLAM family member 5-like [Eublepharis macularius]
MWWLWTVALCPLIESFREGKAEEAIGTLGGSVTFHLKTSKEFTSVSWLRSVQDKPVHFASLDLEAGRPCDIKVIFPKFERRLDVSRDCKNLQIRNLTQDDSGTYRAQIGEDGGTFRLKVYKHLLESDLEVQCEMHVLSDGTYILQLNCSAGKWGDGVSYIWTPTSKTIDSSFHIVQSDFQGNDTNCTCTCTANNPVSSASKTVSIKQACEGQGAVEFTGGHPPYVLTGITIAALIIVKVIVNVISVKCFFSTKQRNTPEKLG